jgi:hypothetical protein
MPGDTYTLARVPGSHRERSEGSLVIQFRCHAAYRAKAQLCKPTRARQASSPSDNPRHECLGHVSPEMASIVDLVESL